MDYALLEQQARAITEGESDLIANLSNVSALLNDALTDINWLGFYLVKDEQLVLGPFQGKVACVRIPFGKGVCGTAITSKQIQLIDDVHAFPGHIACDSASNSELVIPIQSNGKLVAVLDIDSPSFKRFSTNDADGLDLICRYLGEQLQWSTL